MDTEEFQIHEQRGNDIFLGCKQVAIFVISSAIHETEKRTKKKEEEEE